jgi:hypothetical protein
MPAAATGYFAWGCFRYFGRERSPPSPLASSPSSLSLRSSYAGHYASPAGYAWWARQDSNLKFSENYGGKDDDQAVWILDVSGQ